MDQHAASEGRDRILINDLVVDTRIGVHAHEYDAPQRVRINVALDVTTNPAPLSDDLSHVISYEGIIGSIKALVVDGHINLVETLAERIAQICLKSPLALRARVRVEKLDIEPDAAGVGVEIERWRSES